MTAPARSKTGKNELKNSRQTFVVVCGGLWWFVVVCGGLWWVFGGFWWVFGGFLGIFWGFL